MKINLNQKGIEFLQKNAVFNKFQFIKDLEADKPTEVNDEEADEIRDVCADLEVSLLDDNYNSTPESIIASDLVDKFYID